LTYYKHIIVRPSDGLDVLFASFSSIFLRVVGLGAFLSLAASGLRLLDFLSAPRHS
jgi:hypothetical protein